VVNESRPVRRRALAVLAPEYHNLRTAGPALENGLPSAGNDHGSLLCALQQD
jgi:hypothetical protein